MKIEYWFRFIGILQDFKTRILQKHNKIFILAMTAPEANSTYSGTTMFSPNFFYVLEIQWIEYKILAIAESSPDMLPIPTGKSPESFRRISWSILQEFRIFNKRQ